MVYDNLFIVYNYKVHVRSNEIICCSLFALGVQNSKYIRMYVVRLFLSLINVSVLQKRLAEIG